MKKMKHSLYKLLLFCIYLGVLQGCTDEFMPAPVGEAIPAPENPPLSEALAAGSFSLFQAAWDKSEMDEVIAAEYPLSKLTILAPTDEAMKNGDYTQEKINQASKEELDAFIRYHILNGTFSAERLPVSGGAQTFNSLLSHPEFIESEKSGSTGLITVPYRFQHTFSATEEGLIDNEKEISVQESISISQGILIPVNEILQSHDNQIIDVLKEDSRFSLFLNALEINGSLYDQYVLQSYSNNIFIGYKYLTDWHAKTENGYRGTEYLPHVIRFTLFVPTNDAFHQLGIYTEEDIRQLNGRSSVNYGLRASTASDSLLVAHKIASSQLNLDLDFNTFIPGVYVSANNSASNAVFYQYSLNNDLLGNYMIEANLSGGNYLNFDFGINSAGLVTVKQKNSSAEAATIVEEINTIQGPIQVVDRIILPKGFSMWHKK